MPSEIYFGEAAEIQKCRNTDRAEVYFMNYKLAAENPFWHVHAFLLWNQASKASCRIILEIKILEQYGTEPFQKIFQR